ncbi:MAG: hypothetical protein IKV25_02980 [Clostridia bacterium]|nr:hypothetical protein [Clostridia bacterium]
MEKDYEYYSSLPKAEISVRAKRRINRVFREIVGSSRIPHKDVDNAYERTRSFFVRKFRVLFSKVKNHK